jgi:hypothetical protein
MPADRRYPARPETQSPCTHERWLGDGSDFRDWLGRRDITLTMVYAAITNKCREAKCEELLLCGKRLLQIMRVAVFSEKR